MAQSHESGPLIVGGQRILPSWDAFAMTGKTYFVDNVNGNDGYDGSSWDRPFDQVTTAITAAEAWRLAQADPYSIRNRIFIKGTLIGYGCVAALPNYCDIIGVGACPFGNGAGIVRIQGSATVPTTNVASTATADAMAGSCRGVNFYNLQFDAAGAYYAFDGVQVLRSEFHHCAFRNDAAAMAGGLRLTGNSGGIVIDDCRFDGDSGWPVYGIYVSNGITFNCCNVLNSVIMGTTAGIFIGTTVNDQGTLIAHNVIGDFGGGCGKGIDDNGSGYSVKADNYITATDAMELTARGTINPIANHVINTTAGAVELTGTD